MTRQTSVDAYHNFVDKGLAATKRLQVLHTLRDGPLTASQIADAMPGGKSPSVGANVHARLCELRALACVVEDGLVDCPITGNQVLRWKWTGKVPLESGGLEAQATRVEVILLLADALQESLALNDMLTGLLPPALRHSRVDTWRERARMLVAYSFQRFRPKRVPS